MSMTTTKQRNPARSFRISDNLWALVTARARLEHTTASAIVIRALLEYLKGKVEL